MQRDALLESSTAAAALHARPFLLSGIVPVGHSVAASIAKCKSDIPAVADSDPVATSDVHVRLNTAGNPIATSDVHTRHNAASDSGRKSGHLRIAGARALYQQ